MDLVFFWIVLEGKDLCPITKEFIIQCKVKQNDNENNIRPVHIEDSFSDSTLPIKYKVFVIKL